MEGHDFTDHDFGKARFVARSMSELQRAILIRHSDGPQPVHVRGTETTSVGALIDRGLLRRDQRKPARTTIATTLGRLVLGALLAREADARVKAEAV